MSSLIWHNPSVRHKFLLLTACFLAACDSANVAPEPVQEVLTRTPVSSEKPATPPPTSEPAAVGSILINQHGFMQYGPKTGLIVSAGLAPIPFTVRNDMGQTVLSGMSQFATTNDPQSGLPLHRFDFSDLKTHGEGYTIVAGGNVSDPFTISLRPFTQLSRDSLSYFYQSRFAEPVEAAYVPAQTPSLARAAGHTDRETSCFSGSDLRGTNWPGCDYTLEVEGGWYDAGDYGQYSVNTGFATWMLFNMAERGKVKPTVMCPAQMGDNSLLIPEAGNGMGDLLDEARLGVENLMSVQVKSTTLMSLARGAQSGGALRLTATNPQGLVHHKVHGIRWPGSEITPATDNIPRRLYPPTTAATLHLAGIGAMCARIYRGHDNDLSERCLSSAREAFAAAERVPDAYAWAEFTGGGPYDDRDLADEFGWAAAELWITTGEQSYRDAMLARVPEFRTAGAFDWRNVDGFAVMSLALQDDERALTALRAMADGMVAQMGQSASAIPYAQTQFYWGSNGGMLNNAVVLGHAYDRWIDPDYLRGAVGAMDYVLGRNALSRSFVTGYGARPMRNPHHRVWRNGEDSRQPAPPPGVLSGGPNNVDFVDPIGSTLRGRCVGMTCWRDDYDTYSMNEVAINWNAALAWSAHWLDRQAPSCTGRLPG